MIPTDLRSSLQYKDFDILHNFWGLMVAKNRHLLVTMGSVIFRLAVFSSSVLATMGCQIPLLSIEDSEKHVNHRYLVNSWPKDTGRDTATFPVIL